jgi:hypothetical protein
MGPQENPARLVEAVIISGFIMGKERNPLAGARKVVVELNSDRANVHVVRAFVAQTQDQKPFQEGPKRPRFAEF